MNYGRVGGHNDLTLTRVGPTDVTRHEPMNARQPPTPTPDMKFGAPTCRLSYTVKKSVYIVSKDNKNDKIRRIVKQLSLISLTSGLELKTTEWISTILLITPTRQAQDCHAPRQRRPSRSYDGSVPIRWCNLMTVVRPTLKQHLCTCTCTLLLFNIQTKRRICLIMAIWTNWVINTTVVRRDCRVGARPSCAETLPIPGNRFRFGHRSLTHKNLKWPIFSPEARSHDRSFLWSVGQLKSSFQLVLYLSTII